MRLSRRAFLKALGLTAGVLAFSSPRGFASDSIKVESFDSSTRTVREVAKVLSGKGGGVLEPYPPGSELFLWLLKLLPRSLRIAGIEWGISLAVGNPLRKLKSFATESLPKWCASQYPERKYPAIIIGSPNGAVAHLAALLEAPFLTSSFLLGFKHHMEPDDITSYYKFGKEAGNRLLERGSGIEIVTHYDPLHDRALVKSACLIRVKLKEVPKAYQEFIAGCTLANLAEEGTVQPTLILINCDYPWPQYKVGEDSYLQVGGLGEVSGEEFLAKWSLDLAQDVRAESEWGCPETFASSVKEFATANGFPLLELKFDHPERYSLLAYQAYLKAAGVRKTELIMDCFTYLNPYTNVLTGVPSLWLPFNTRDSYVFAEEFLDDKRCPRIYLALVPSFAKSPDTVSLREWEELLAQKGKLKLLGIDAKTFPADPLAPFSFNRAMRQLRREYKLRQRLKLDLATVEELVNSGSL